MSSSASPAPRRGLPGAGVVGSKALQHHLAKGLLQFPQGFQTFLKEQTHAPSAQAAAHPSLTHLYVLLLEKVNPPSLR